MPTQLQDHDAVIVSAKRTPVGSFQGSLSSFTAPQLGSIAISSALQAAGIATEQVQEVIFGEVLTAGVGQAPARQAALGAGLLSSTPCVTINKVCGSGLKAVMLASDGIRLGHFDVAIAGGQESMSLAPHLLPNSRLGFRMGPAPLMDSMILDGLWDPYNNFHMGNAGELAAKELGVTRGQQDEWAQTSYLRAQAAQKSGAFKAEIAPATVKGKKGDVIVDTDEEPAKAQFDKLLTLKSAFQKDGTITAANASKINDGASALVVMSHRKAKELGTKPVARVVAHGTFAQDPKWFTTAPAGAIRQALDRAGLKVGDIDLWEINEAFALVALLAMRQLEIPAERVNVNGGAIAIGHPIGASGARILTTLVHSLHHQGKRFGLATLCVGGGEGVALIVERI